MFLLRETDRTVTDVRFDVGFTGLSTFTRTIREIVGQTPSGYRAGHAPICGPSLCSADRHATLSSAVNPPKGGTGWFGPCFHQH